MVLFAGLPLLVQWKAVLKTRKLCIQHEYSARENLMLVCAFHRVEDSLFDHCVACERVATLVS
jgi:hypothetical protein